MVLMLIVASFFLFEPYMLLWGDKDQMASHTEGVLTSAVPVKKKGGIREAERTRWPG